MQTSTSITATGPAAFGVIAERFRRAGQPDKAVALCREGLEKFPDHLSARVTLGWSLLDIGEHQEAFDQLKSVLKRAPDNLAAIRGLAELHERGIGLSFDSLPDGDGDMELDPVMPAFDTAIPAFGAAMPAFAAAVPAPFESELDPVMPATSESELDPFLSATAESELDPVMPAMFEGELDPVMPAIASAMAADVDPVAPDAELAPAWEMAGELDPFIEPEEPETPLFVAAPVAAQFEIEDVIDAGEPDAMFDLSGLLALGQLDEPALVDVPAPALTAASNVIAMPEPVLPRRITAVVEGAPLALRDEADLGGTSELTEWLSRVRDRRVESMSQYMAG